MAASCIPSSPDAAEHDHVRLSALPFSSSGENACMRSDGTIQHEGTESTIKALDQIFQKGKNTEFGKQTCALTKKYLHS
jgi:hypothetical protein